MSKYPTTSLLKSLKSVVQANIPKLPNVCLKQNGVFSKLTDETQMTKSTATTVLKSSPQSPSNTTNTILTSKYADELDDVAKSERGDISSWQAGFNVTNAIQGMSMVSLPYTVLEGGYVALLSMIVVAQVCCYTGDILIDCLYDERRDIFEISRDTAEVTLRKRVRRSYVEIAEEVWGKKFGGRVVYLAQLIELVMTCTLYVLLCGELLSGMFPNDRLSLTHWIVISTFPLLPCAVLRSMKHVAWLSFWCTICHAMSNGIVLIYCLFMVDEWKPDLIRLQIDVHTLPISLGIVIFSYTSQVFLPSIEGSMIEKQNFKRMMFWSHLTAAVFKVTFAFVGFVTFGPQTQEVITNNLPTHLLKFVVNVFLVSKALLSFPLPYFATLELLENTFSPVKNSSTPYKNLDSSKTSINLCNIFLRVCLVCLMPILAASIPHFAILLALIGSFTGNMLSLVWPAYFHYILRKHSLSFVRKMLNVLIILLGLFCGIVGIFFNARALHNAILGFETKPFQGYL